MTVLIEFCTEDKAILVCLNQYQYNSEFYVLTVLGYGNSIKGRFRYKEMYGCAQLDILTEANEVVGQWYVGNEWRDLSVPERWDIRGLKARVI